MKKPNGGIGMLPLLVKQIKTEAAGNTCGVSVLLLSVGRKHCAASQHLVLCVGSVLVRHKLGELMGRAGIWAIRTLTHPEERLLFSFLRVQLIFKSLFSGLQQIPPLLQQLVVLFIQLLEPLSLILNQQVAFFILQLLQLSDVAFALTNHLPHLVLVFLLLMQPLRPLPLLLLLRKLFDLLSVLRGASC